MHTKPMEDSHGVFGNEKVSKLPCPDCGGVLNYKIWKSHCGGYEDTRYKCRSCYHIWGVDGSDSYGRHNGNLRCSKKTGW